MTAGAPKRNRPADLGDHGATSGASQRVCRNGIEVRPDLSTVDAEVLTKV